MRKSHVLGREDLLHVNDRLGECNCQLDVVKRCGIKRFKHGITNVCKAERHPSVIYTRAVQLAGRYRKQRIGIEGRGSQSTCKCTSNKRGKVTKGVYGRRHESSKCVQSEMVIVGFLLAHGSDDGFAAISGNPVLLTGLYRLTHHISGPARKREITTSRRDITVVLVTGRGGYVEERSIATPLIAKRKGKNEYGKCGMQGTYECNVPA